MTSRGSDLAAVLLLFLFDRFFSSSAASTPGPVTAWRGVTGPGVPPLEAAWEALVLPADRCCRRLLAGRTRAAAALSEEHRCRATSVFTAEHSPAGQLADDSFVADALVRLDDGRKTKGVVSAIDRRRVLLSASSSDGGKSTLDGDDCL